MPTKTTKKPSTPKTPRKTAVGAAAEGAASGTEVTPKAVKQTAGNSAVKQQREDLDIEYFRGLLLQEMARLEEEREYLRRSSGDMDGNLPEDAEGEEDTADLASSLMDKEMDLSVEEEIEETMDHIEHAFQKIDDGTYGICDVSAKPIPRSRLELLPWASLTVECQSIAEGE